MKKLLTIREFCLKNDIWYLRLPFDIPSECVNEVKEIYNQGFFVPHGNGSGGGRGWGAYSQAWHSTSLHGFCKKNENIDLGWRYTMNPGGYGIEEEDVIWGWTEIKEIAPEMVRFLKEFPHTRYRRCRYMLLRPQGEILPHNDLPFGYPPVRNGNINSAINIAITQPKGCYLRRCDTKEELPFEPLAGYWFDNTLEHEGFNNTKENRFHFIVHGGSNNERKKLMLESLKKLVGYDVEKEIIL